MVQGLLFGDEPFQSPIQGLTYETEFLGLAEEKQLISVIETLPLEGAQYKQYVARRRVMSFGGSYDFDANQLLPAAALDERLNGLRDRVAHWLGVEPEALVHTLVAEYAPGTPLGWHRDVPDFETVVGVSLGGSANLRLRPYPDIPAVRKVVQLDVAPRSIYALSGEARWGWQHCISPTKQLRWSVTFRTKRLRA